MSNIATINNHDLTIKEYIGQRVVTLKDIDAIHERPEGTAKRNFNTNKEYFIKGEDYHEITKREFSTNFVPNSKERGNPDLTVVLITQTGYLMLVKSFTDKLAWKVQRELVKSYFNTQTMSPTTQISNPISQIPSSSDIALYHISEAIKAIIIRQNESDNTITKYKHTYDSFSDYVGETLTEIGYEINNLETDIKEQSNTIQNNCAELADEIVETQMLTDAHTIDIEEMKQQIQYLLNWRIDQIDEFLTDHNTLYELNHVVANLNSDSPILNKAQKIALLSDKEYRQWVNSKINEMAKSSHRWTGRIRNDTYKILTEQIGYKYLTNRCNLTQIVYGNWKNIKLAYALILCGCTQSDFKELNLLSA